MRSAEFVKHKAWRMTMGKYTCTRDTVQSDFVSDKLRNKSGRWTDVVWRLGNLRIGPRVLSYNVCIEKDKVRDSLEIVY